MQRSRTRLSATSLAALVTAVVMAFGSSWTLAAYAGPGESDLVGDINAARAGAGLPSYAVADGLEAMAEAQAGRMAAQLTIFHNPNLAGACCWRSLGENVGVGGDVPSVNAAFLASPEHLANMLSVTFTQVAVGTAVGTDGRIYVDEVFRLPNEDDAPAKPAPKPTRAPAPPVTVTPSSAPSPSLPAATASPGSTAPTTAPRTAVPTTPAVPTAPATTSAPTTAAPPTQAPTRTAAATSSPPLADGAVGVGAPHLAPSLTSHLSQDGSAGSEQPAAQPVPLLIMTAGQRSQLAAAALLAGPAGGARGVRADPLASTLRWWRTMDALTAQPHP